jgi:hypothetical protein
MKRVTTRTVLFTLLLAGFLSLPQRLLAHKQWVHQYIVKEAYALLANSLGPIPQMSAHVGDTTEYYHASRRWQLPYMTTGAWREDEEDVIYGYEISHNPPLLFSSISHFWDADRGDLTQNTFQVSFPPYAIGPYENAYQKLRSYVNAGWVLWFPYTIEVRRVSNGHRIRLQLLIDPPPLDLFGIPLAYTSLTNLLQTSRMTFHGNITGPYVATDIDEFPPRIVNGEVFEITVGTDIRDRIVWEALGRMCHLLGDMSVPTHTRADEHGIDQDTYENWVGDQNTRPWLRWNAANVGNWINPYTSDTSLVPAYHFLMYTMQQQANHFGSIGPYEGTGNDSLGGEGRPQELSLLQSLNIGSYGPPTTPAGPWTQENLENIRDRTLPFAIRATAGLLYWFAREAQLITTDVHESAQSLPDGFALSQNYPNPFNPTTEIGFRIGDYGLVTLKVLDVLGREVVTLVNEEKTAGAYTVRWDASGVASGVYFYRLEAGSFVESKKLVLLQ